MSNIVNEELSIDDTFVDGTCFEECFVVQMDSMREIFFRYRCCGMLGDKRTTIRQRRDSVGRDEIEGGIDFIRSVDEGLVDILKLIYEG